MGQTLNSESRVICFGIYNKNHNMSPEIKHYIQMWTTTHSSWVTNWCQQCISGWFPNRPGMTQSHSLQPLRFPPLLPVMPPPPPPPLSPHHSSSPVCDVFPVPTAVSASYRHFGGAPAGFSPSPGSLKHRFQSQRVKCNNHAKINMSWLKDLLWCFDSKL